MCLFPLCFHELFFLGAGQEWFLYFLRTFPGTIPSSFAGLPELPDQYPHDFHQGSLKTGDTRNYLSPLLQRVPRRNPLFFCAYFQMCFSLLSAKMPLPHSLPIRFARVHRSPPGPACKGCPTASRILVPCCQSHPGSIRCTQTR